MIGLSIRPTNVILSVKIILNLFKLEDDTGSLLMEDNTPLVMN